MANSNFIVKNGLTVGPVTIDAATGNIDGIAAANIASIANGNSNVSITGNANVTVYVAGNATARAVFTSTGANIAGTANVTGNANVGNLGTATAVITTANVTTINSGLLQNGTSNVTVNSSGNVNISVGGNVLTVTSTGANIAGYLNIATGTLTAAQPILTKSVTWNNASVTFTALSTSITDTASAAGSNIADWQVGGSSKFSVNKAGNTSVAGTLNVTGNANTGNLGTTTAIITTGNITTINSGLMQNGNSNVTITANSNVTIAVTAANSYTFATGSFAPSANATVQLGLTGARWSNIWGLASSAQYADLAEYYVSDADYEPGTVVDFGGVNEVTICGTVMSTKIAGVVSTEPGFVMNDGQAGEFTLPIALQGRVPTKVVGKVNKGDMMVSAGNGYAHSCSAPVIGSVIGKALADFDGTEGVIEVVVGRV